MRLMVCVVFFFFFLMIRRPPRSTLDRSSAASDVYKRQRQYHTYFNASNLQDMELLLQWEVAGLSEDAKQQEQLLMELPVPGQ